MATFEKWFQQDLNDDVVVRHCESCVFTEDNLSNIIGVTLTKGGVPASVSGTVQCNVIRGDSATITFTGTLSGNQVSATLPQAAFVYTGFISVILKIISGTTKTTVLKAIFTVERTTTDTIVDPSHVIPSIAELLAKIEEMEQGTTAANTAASAANTAAGKANTAATNADNKASAANTAASSANTAASNANSKATAADTAATAANTAATAANTAAENANAKATLANTAATNANTKADAANTAAQNATTATTNADAATARANAAAEALEDMTVAGSTLLPSQPATAEISTVEGHYHIDLGIPQGVKGDTGSNAAITAQATAYQNSTSGTVIPDGTWLDTQPSTPQGQFLWVRRTITWNNGTETVLYSVSRMGIDGSGSVVSVNGVAPDAQGDVALTGARIPVSSTDATKLDAALGAINTALAGKADSSSLAAVATSGRYSDLSGTPGVATTSENGLMSSGDKTVVERIKNVNSNLAIVANGNTAPSAISAGQYVIWGGLLYTAKSAIASGATLSTSNLTAVSGGGLNKLNSDITSLNSNLAKDIRDIDQTATNNRGTVRGQLLYDATTCTVCLIFTSSVSASNSPGILGIGSLKPKNDSAMSCIDITGGIASAITGSIPCGISTNGTIFVKEIIEDHVYTITGTFIRNN